MADKLGNCGPSYDMERDNCTADPAIINTTETITATNQMPHTMSSISFAVSVKGSKRGITVIKKYSDTTSNIKPNSNIKVFANITNFLILTSFQQW